MKTVRTFLLMLTLTLLFILIGELIGGRGGMIFALVLAGLMNFFAYWFSDKIVLMMYHARPISESDAPEIYRMVRNLTTVSHLPMPKLYIIPMDMPNAFATGRNPNHAAVALTEGIIRLLNRNELEGVIAHELSHVKNRDTLIAVMAATIAGAIFMIARMAQFAAMFGGGMGGRDERNRSGGIGALALLVVAIIAPIAALMIQMAISRTREYQADESASMMTRNPLALASALRRLQQGVERFPTEVNPTTSHLFIVNPLRGESLLTLFSTHPPISKRIKKLEEMAYRMK